MRTSTILLLLSSLLTHALPVPDSPFIQDGPKSGVTIDMYPTKDCTTHDDHSDYHNAKYRHNYNDFGFDAKAFWLSRALHTDESLAFNHDNEGSTYYTATGELAKKGCNFLPDDQKGANYFVLDSSSK
ncbi:MAG: hypothetical protein Q9170_001952 [Blastenia crenularia]